MIRSFNRRTRCAAASRRGSVAAALCDEPALAERDEVPPLERDELARVERDERARLLPLVVPPLLLLLRVVRRVPLDPLLEDRLD
jgi:hypothetical protein